MKKILPLVLLLILSYFSWRPLLLPGYFSMHDDQQVVRLQQLDKSLKAGQFPVRWVEDLGFGYGYPVFNFYPPLAYYLGELGVLWGLGYINSIKLVWFLALVGSGFAMYFLAKEFFGETGGLVSAIFYIYAPYHAVDAYVRGALAELCSFVWLPLILLTTYKKKTILTGILLGLLMITHNLIFLPFMGFFAVWAFFFDKKSLIFSPIIAFGLTTFFWLPELWEKQFTLVDQILIKNLASYSIHFLCPSQLWYSPWGFGGSVAGCADGMSFALGKIYFLVIVAGLAVALLKKNWVGLTSFFLLIFSIFMTLPFSQFIWDKISLLWYLQFPWRFLEFVALFSSLIAGAIFIFLKNKYFKMVTATVLILGTIFFNAKYFQPQTYLPTATDVSQTTDQRIKWDISATSFEYMPKGIATKINNLGVVWVDIDQSEISDSKFEIQNGEANIRYWNPDSFSVSGNFNTNAIFQPQITNFPGWRVWIDGKSVSFRDDNKYKLITVDIPSGDHEITGKFTDTPVRMIGNLISALFIVGTAGFLIYGLRRNQT